MLIEARAKVNLYLRVGGRRPDGYHDLQTLFHSISLADQLRVEEARELTVECSDPSLPSGEGNLAFRAARLLADRCGVHKGARIRIEKRIPAQAGLGGGSADAAAALVALNRLWHLDLPPEQLETWGAELGADVPFCVRGGAAFAEGIGEKLTPLPPLPPLPLVLVKPEAAISTRLAYEALDTLPDRGGPPPDRALEVVRSGDTGSLPAVLYNDFEAVAIAHFPPVAQAKEALQAATGAALLSGSGAALFGLASSPEQAYEVARELGKNGWWTAVATFADFGPLLSS